MTMRSDLEDQAITLAAQIFPKLWMLVWLGLALLLVGFLIPGHTVALAFAVSASTVFTLALLVLLLNRKNRSSTQFFTDSLGHFIEHDKTPMLFTDSTGSVTYANKATRAVVPDGQDMSLIALLRDVVSNPVQLIFDLQNLSQISNSAQRVYHIGRETVTLSVQRIDPEGFLWRLSRVSWPEEDETSIGFPHFEVDGSGQALRLNKAARALFGRSPVSVQKMFGDQDPSSGDIVEGDTVTGPRRFQVSRLDRADGRAEFVLAPAPDHPAGAGQSSVTDLPVALLKCDSTGRILAASQPAQELLNVTEAKGLRIQDLIQELGRPVADWIADVAKGRGGQKSEVVQVSCGTVDRFVEISLRPTGPKTSGAVFAVLSDATELKSLEAQFVQSQKMQAIGQLAGGIAHDFNNLLTAISGYCELLLVRHDEGDPDFADLQQIRQNANRAASLVGHLLAFSRKQNLQAERVELAELLADLSHLLNRLLGENMRLKIETQSDLSGVKADPRQLEQVFVNLVVNARDAMGKAGEVVIRTANQTLDRDVLRERATVPAGDYVSISVSDTGCGIPQDKLSKVFEPFFTTKEVGKGTGLGLSTVYGIVKQSGGYVFASSEVGKGTLFEVLIPAFDTENDVLTLPKNRAEPQANVNGGRILLVEDEAPVRDFAARALKLRGYTVYAAEDADAALALLQDPDLDIDVFVTDVMMPGKDGPTWVREALADRPLVKVIFISGYAREQVAGQQLEIENAVFLPKPFSLTELTETVGRQLTEAAPDHVENLRRQG